MDLKPIIFGEDIGAEPPKNRNEEIQAVTVNVNLSMAICPAEFTVMIGMVVPSAAEPLAVKVSRPDGFVSEAE